MNNLYKKYTCRAVARCVMIFLIATLYYINSVGDMVSIIGFFIDLTIWPCGIVESASPIRPDNSAKLNRLLVCQIHRSGKQNI